jgi:hypothetical protein
MEDLWGNRLYPLVQEEIGDLMEEDDAQAWLKQEYPKHMSDDLFEAIWEEFWFGLHPKTKELPGCIQMLLQQGEIRERRERAEAAGQVGTWTNAEFGIVLAGTRRSTSYDNSPADSEKRYRYG